MQHPQHSLVPHVACAQLSLLKAWLQLGQPAIHSELVAFDVQLAPVAFSEETGSNAQARLLIPGGSIGAIMGKKGETLAELRQSSGANIRVHDGHELPACGRSGDRLVTVRHPACKQPE